MPFCRKILLDKADKAKPFPSQSHIKLIIAIILVGAPSAFWIFNGRAQSVNNSFGKDKHSEVVFYKYTPESATSTDATTANGVLNPTTATQTPQVGNQFKSEIRAAPDPKLSDRLLERKAPIVQDIGRLLKRIGF